MQKRSTLRRTVQRQRDVSWRFCAAWICQGKIRPWAERGELRARGSWSLPKRLTSFRIEFEEMRWKSCGRFTPCGSGPRGLVNAEAAEKKRRLGERTYLQERRVGHQRNASAIMQAKAIALRLRLRSVLV